MELMKVFTRYGQKFPAESRSAHSAYIALAKHNIKTISQLRELCSGEAPKISSLSGIGAKRISLIIKILKYYDEIFIVENTEK